MPYIDWAVANEYAVMDVNMPMHVENPEVYFRVAIPH